MKRKKQFILMLTILVLPGFFLGNAYISFTDIIIPSFFLIEFFEIDFNGSFKINKMDRDLSLFILLCIFSVIIASISNGVFYGEAFLKTFRLLECLLIAFLARKWYFSCDNFEEETDLLFAMLILLGIISAAVAIWLFLTQSMIFRPQQLMSFNGYVMRRAEGVFGDAQSFSLTMSIIFIIAVIFFINNKNRILSGIAVFTLFLAIVFSDTRAAFFAILLSIIFYIVINGILNPKMVVTLVVTAIAVFVLYFNNAYFNRFISERINPVIRAALSFHYENLSGISSNRFQIWSDALERFLSNNFLHKLIGTGYKVWDSDTTDNFFIYSLITTGILGFITTVKYWGDIFSFSLKKRNINNVEIFTTISVGYLIFMIFCDAMTLYRSMYLYVYLMEIVYLQSKTSRSI